MLNAQDGAREEEGKCAVMFPPLPRQEVGETQVAALNGLCESPKLLGLARGGELCAECTKECIGGVLHACLVQSAAASRHTEADGSPKMQRIDHIAHTDPPPFSSKSASPCNRSCVMAFSVESVKCFT